jgi:Protein of unknown function, DUF547
MKVKRYQIILSENILSKAKIGEDTSSLRRELYYIRPRTLEKNLHNDDLKKAFWLNIYNAFYIILKNDSEQKDEKLKEKKVKVARSYFSLNDIEHGILRRQKFRFGFGYFNNPFYSSFIKSISVQKTDYRIHFALRCNQLSDYPVHFFEHKIIENQLDIVAKVFLNSEATANTQFKKRIAPRFVFFHFKDFGGLHAIKKIMASHLVKT